MITDRDFKIKKWDPRVILHSIKYGTFPYFGVGETQITHDGVPCTNVKTAVKTIGVFGKADCDFNFTAPVNVTAQHIDLGSIVPAYATVLGVKVRCNESPLGLVSLALTAGNASAGAQFMASIQCFALNAIVATLLALLWTVAPTNAASNVFIGATPGANWSLDTTKVGKWTVYVTYIEI